MNIPKSYEALAADLASEKILSKTLLGQKDAYMMLADKGALDLSESKAREAALREELARYKSLFGQAQKAIDRLNDLHPKRMGELAKRLTVAEQLLSQVEGVCDLAINAIDDDERGANFVKIIQAIKDKAELKPAAEGEGS